jgi:cytochrome c biogenesis protein CcmG, thiol:disulfide interchange protein DsbE
MARVGMACTMLVVMLLGATSVTAAAIGEVAPPIRATLLDGTSFDSSGARGKVVVVNYWATWCAPCRAEMPALDAYYRAHRGDGLVLVAISMDDASSVDKVRALAQDFAFPVAMGTGSRPPGYGRVWHLPMSIVIDRNGVLREDDWFAENGLDPATLDRVLGPLLRAPVRPAKPAT